MYWLGTSAAVDIYGAAERADLAALTEIVGEPDGPRDRLAEVELLFSGWGAPMLDAAFLERAPRLRAVFYGAGSVRGIVSDAMWERGIRITSAYVTNAVPVAEYTLATILLSLKHFWRFAHGVRHDGRYPPRWRVPGNYHSTVGLVSLGMIGRLVRERLRPFDLRVIAYDPFCSAAEATRLGVELRSLEAVFAEADVVSLHTPWIPETVGMVTGAHLASMKEGATFINTARGAVVRETEMIGVIQQRPDLQFVLDVTHPEPPVPGSALYALPNVVLTPHIAGSMAGECQRMGRFMVDELKRYLAGEPLQGEITREKAARMA